MALPTLSSMFSASNLISMGLVAFASPDRIPNEEAIALSPTLGWLFGACALVIFILFVVQKDRWRNFWLTTGDPRPLALFRIVFAFLAICNINDVWEYFTMLFTDEGIFFTDVARQVFAAEQFKGFGDGFGPDDPYGFFDLDGLLHFLKGHKYSLLFFWDSPSAFWLQILAFYILTSLFMIGFKTRITGILSFFLMTSIFLRNSLFWEGTEAVYQVFFFYLILSRSGHAYSVDNWLRCRKLRKRGLLSERGKAGNGAGIPPCPEYPQGLAAVYRQIPIWPQWLIILNLAALYCYTGVVKNGLVWARGDALYYALNMDHFYRFYPQEISTIFGTNLFRLATWITHWWEALFPLMVFGLITRWAAHEPLNPLLRWQKIAIRICGVLLVLLSMMILVIALPVHMPLNDARQVVWNGSLFSIGQLQVGFAIAWLLVISIIVALWWVMGHRPLKVRIRGNLYILDRKWFCTWILGRRVWLPLGILFHGNLFLLMNIGMFPPIMMAIYLACLKGDEPSRILRFFARRLLFWIPWIPQHVRKGEPPLPLERDDLPYHHRDQQHLPLWFLFTLLGVAGLGIFADVFEIYSFGWTALGIGCALIAFTYYQSHRHDPHLFPKLAVVLAFLGFYMWLWGQTDKTFIRFNLMLHLCIGTLLLLSLFKLTRNPLKLSFRQAQPSNSTVSTPTSFPSRSGKPWAYGPAGRMLVGAFVVWHITAVAIWLMPEKDSLSAFRIRARSLFQRYLLLTHTSQSWGMFAPNPPRHNVFMKTVLTDQTGEKWDLRTDVYAPERKPIPWIWNDRMRKMNRRMIGGESGQGDWYLKWYGRYLCREWTKAHYGVAPKKIDLIKISYAMPSPEQVRSQGYYQPEILMLQRGREEVKHTENCRHSLNAQLPNEIRSRYNLPLVDETTVKKWHKNRKKAWDTRDESEFLKAIKNEWTKFNREVRKKPTSQSPR